MISVAICDDENRICEFLKRSVYDYFASEDIDGKVTLFCDGEPLVETYKNGTADFDMILLDITMKKCDGMTAAKKIRELDENVMIVFVTASAEYVFSGYQVKAFRYILKPELLHGFNGVFRDCIKELTRSNEINFTFQNSGKTISVPAKDIIYFESDKRKVTVKCINSAEYTFYEKLDDIEEKLKKHDFVRCHQSYLVNAKRISGISPGLLELATGETLPISRHRAKETNEAFLWAMR